MDQIGWRCWHRTSTQTQVLLIVHCDSELLETGDITATNPFELNVIPKISFADVFSPHGDLFAYAHSALLLEVCWTPRRRSRHFILIPPMTWPGGRRCRLCSGHGFGVAGLGPWHGAVHSSESGRGPRARDLVYADHAGAGAGAGAAEDQAVREENVIGICFENRACEEDTRTKGKRVQRVQERRLENCLTRALLARRAFSDSEG